METVLSNEAVAVLAPESAYAYILIKPPITSRGW
jgi:hypothetical protein